MYLIIIESYFFASLGPEIYLSDLLFCDFEPHSLHAVKATAYSIFFVLAALQKDKEEKRQSDITERGETLFQNFVKQSCPVL
jgi:hypothetical protein